MMNKKLSSTFTSSAEKYNPLFHVVWEKAWRVLVKPMLARSRLVTSFHVPSSGAEGAWQIVTPEPKTGDLEFFRSLGITIHSRGCDWCCYRVNISNRIGVTVLRQYPSSCVDRLVISSSAVLSNSVACDGTTACDQPTIIRGGCRPSADSMRRGFRQSLF